MKLLAWVEPPTLSKDSLASEAIFDFQIQYSFSEIYKHLIVLLVFYSTKSQLRYSDTLIITNFAPYVYLNQ